MLFSRILLLWMVGVFVGVFILADPSYHRNARRSPTLTMMEDDPFYRPSVASRDLYLPDYRGACPNDACLSRSSCDPSYRRSYTMRSDPDSSCCS